MSDPQKAIQAQLANIVERTGKSVAQLHALLSKSGRQKHGELVTFLKKELHMGHGDANTVVHTFRDAAAASSDAAAPTATTSTSQDPLAGMYAGSKAPLRALHDAVMAQIERLGKFEVAPKKAYVSLRRKKQFAMVGPGTKGRLEIGLNMRDVEATDRLVAQPDGGMCQYKVHVSNLAEVDKQLLVWVRTAYDGAG